jgi:hypothetical protein
MIFWALARLAAAAVCASTVALLVLLLVLVLVLEVAAVVAMLVVLYVKVSAQSPGLRPEEATRGALGDRPCRGGR